MNKKLFWCALTLFVFARQAAAVDGCVGVTGGGMVAFTNAAEQTWVQNSDGSRDLLLKCLPTDADHPSSFVLPGKSLVRYSPAFDRLLEL